MENKEEKYIPIGSVVQIDDSKFLAMIVGYNGKDTSKEKVFDYIAVPYPAGFLSKNTTIVFDKNRIGKVLFEGYKDDVYKKMIESIKD